MRRLRPNTLIAAAVLLALAGAAQAQSLDVPPGAGPATGDGMQGHVDPDTGRIVPAPAGAPRAARAGSATSPVPIPSPTPVAAPGGGLMMRTDNLTFEATGAVDAAGHPAVECDQPSKAAR